MNENNFDMETIQKKLEAAEMKRSEQLNNKKRVLQEKYVQKSQVIEKMNQELDQKAAVKKQELDNHLSNASQRQAELLQKKMEKAKAEAAKVEAARARGSPVKDEAQRKEMEAELKPKWQLEQE